MCLARGASASTRLITLASVLNRKCGSIWPCSRRSWASLALSRALVSRYRIEKYRRNSALINSEMTASEMSVPEFSTDSSVTRPKTSAMPMGQPIAVPSRGSAPNSTPRFQPVRSRIHAVPNSAKVNLNRTCVM